ncbi:MAG: hypothetical protein AB7F43_08385 [Bacteriovoracia bacterium]
MNLKKASILALLDDAVDGDFRSFTPWHGLVLAMLHKKLRKIEQADQRKIAAKTALPVALPSARVKNTKGSEKIFSSRATLREMMHDYNGRTNTLPPIKSSRPRKITNGFSFDSVELIQLPSISGKILRPK